MGEMAGPLPLFPLGSVLFPGTALPLRVAVAVSWPACWAASWWA